MLQVMRSDLSQHGNPRSQCRHAKKPRAGAVPGGGLWKRKKDKKELGMV